MKIKGKRVSNIWLSNILSGLMDFYSKVVPLFFWPPSLMNHNQHFKIEICFEMSEAAAPIGAIIVKF